MARYLVLAVGAYTAVFRAFLRYDVLYRYVVCILTFHGNFRVSICKNYYW